MKITLLTSSLPVKSGPRSGKKFRDREKITRYTCENTHFCGVTRGHGVCHSTRRVAGLIKTRQVRELGELGRQPCRGITIPW